MVDLKIGRHGVVLLAALFLIFAIQDLLIWLRQGVVPGIEFFLGSLLVLAVFAIAIYEAGQYPPPPPFSRL